MRPNLFGGPAGLGGRHLHTQIWSTFLAETLARVPAFFPAHPGGAARALDEIAFNLFSRPDKRLVMIPLPGGAAGTLAQRGGLVENTAEQAAGGIQCAANGADGPCLETGADAGSAAVAEKFKLEPAIR